MFIHQVIKEWGPTLETNLDSMLAHVRTAKTDGILPSEEAQERLDTIKEMK